LKIKRVFEMQTFSNIDGSTNDGSLNGPKIKKENERKRRGKQKK
jgi:hypothetical protein